MNTLNITEIYYYMVENGLKDKRLDYMMLRDLIELCADTNFLVDHGGRTYIYIHHQCAWTILKDAK